VRALPESCAWCQPTDRCCEYSLLAAFESAGHVLRRLIQSVIEAGEPCVIGPCPPGDLGERSQVDAVKASKAVLFGKFASGSA
jgi:hypothetical protein